MQQILKTYLKRLTNLSANNKTLVLLRLLSDQHIDIHDFDFVENKPSFSIIEDLLSGKGKIKVSAVADSRDKTVNTITKRLHRLKRIEKFIYEERGSKDLYVGWPFVWGQLSDGNPVRCPLLFFPVAIENDGKHWHLEVRKEVNITFNKTFLLAYAHYNQVKIEDELLEWVLDGSEKDSTIIRTILYQLLKESPVELNFNQEIFIDKLNDFKEFKKDDYLSATALGELKLIPEAVLGIFPQAGSHLVPDYLSLLEDSTIPDLEEFFASKTNTPEETPFSPFFHNYLNKVKEEQTYAPYRLDGYQENALKAAKEGNSIVIQGPPGTGKSQLICNLISDYLANGKNVLVVSQKRAALDVVYNRLDKNEFSDFVALVHDFKSDRKWIYEKIATQIEKLYEYRMKNNSLDAIELERKFLALSRSIDRITEELEEYKSALFDESEAGISAKELYLSSSPLEDFVDLRQQYRALKIPESEDFQRRLEIFTEYSGKLDRPDYPWNNRKSFSGYSISDFKIIKEYIDEVFQYQLDIGTKTKEIVHTEIDLETAKEVYQKNEKIDELLELIKDDRVFEFFKIIARFRDSETDLLWLANTERIINECFKGVGPEHSLKAEDLGRFQEALQRGMNARKNPFSWFTWRFFSKDKIFVSRVIVANGLKNNKAGFDTLVKKIDNRLNLEHYLTKLKDKQWLTDLPNTLNKADFQTWFFYQKKALNAKIIYSSIRNLKEYFNLNKLDKNDFAISVNELLSVFSGVSEKYKDWTKYLTNSEISFILDDVTNTERLKDTLEKDFDSLCDFDKIKESFATHEQEIIDKIFEKVEKPSPQKVIDLFRNSLKLSWVEHIESKYPVLRNVSSLQQKKTIQELKDAVEEKKKISKSLVLLRNREKTYKNVEYNRLNNLVTYRDLQHQVTKKRKVWPVRKLISTFSEELFDLIPCWMASPESVSAVFPMKSMFDLVIFDEASQCFTERGLPAMYRGKQVIIAGDEKQLRPNDLYSVRWDNEDSDESIPELEIESLLDLASRYLPNIHLQGHYRSKRLELIHFSNTNFYDNRLNLLPDFEDVNDPSAPIEYHKIDGVWAQNQNLKEAEYIAKLVKKISLEEPAKEIGIVAFNAKQQYAVAELLDDVFSEENIPIPESLIIKNIENVQGDEKDIIIFSIGYAPDEKGRFTMQFGSLNTEGGENRLNVAVSRARERVIVVSSVLPSELRVDDTKNIGPKLLKKYLEYAKSISEGQRINNTLQTKDPSGLVKLSAKLSDLSKRFEAATFTGELPFSDLTIRYKEKFAGVILTDDDTYFSSITIKDPYVYTPLTLKHKNWVFEHFNSRTFWINRKTEEERMDRFLNRCIEKVDGEG
ncbi:MAG: AAA domain-containing protein [Bacteroidota bacterium]